MSSNLVKIAIGTVLIATVAGSAYIANETLSNNETDDISENKPENIIYISVDGLSANHLPCYGYDRSTAPNLCGNKDFTVYQNAYTTSVWERLSIPATMTGKYPHKVNVIDSHTPLHTNYTTIAEAASSQDYRTVMRMGNLFFPEETNASQGFDDYEYIGREPEGRINEFSQLTNNHSKLYYRLHLVGSHNPLDPALEHYNYSNYTYIDGVNTPLSVKVAEKRAEYRENHDKSVFQDIAAEERTQVVNHYDENIRAVDHYLGDYIKTLKQNGEYENSLIIVTGSYGMSFNDTGQDIWNHMNSNPSVSKVPLLVKYPGETGGTSNTLTSTMDPFKIITNEINYDVDYELDAIDPRFEEREVHYTYTKRGSSITNGTHFIFRNILRDTTTSYTEESSEFTKQETVPRTLEEKLFNFTESYQDHDFHRIDYGYEDLPTT